MTRPSPNTRHLWEIDKNQLQEMTSNLSEAELALLDAFIKNPNKTYIDAERVAFIERQDGITERWKYSLSENLFVIVDGYLPGPWSSNTAESFHVCILQEVYQSWEINLD